MHPAEYPGEIRSLLAHLKRLPGIGPRAAERLTLHLLEEKPALASELAKALEAAVTEVRACDICGFFCSHQRTCALCADPERSGEILCVVEQPADVLRLDRTGAFQGKYHVLGGRLSPLDNVHPEDLRLASLWRRVETAGVTEVILAVGSDVEGEATAHYVRDHLARFPHVKVTRLAQGLPAGGSLDHTDEITLHRALRDRRVL